MKPRIRFMSCVVAVVLAASGVAAGALPAGAAPASPTNKYVALGDSYAAGQGGGDYLNDCLQSPSGYPALLDAVKGTNLLRNASCSLATTDDVTDTQLSALNRGTTLVTLTVGGNDLNVAGIAAVCLSPDLAACQQAISDATFFVSSGQLSASLVDTYTKIDAAAPRAHTIVTGYPYLFEPSAIDPRITQLNMATTLLNQAIQGAVVQAQLAGASIEYVDVSGAFSGHGIGSLDPWIYMPPVPDAFHPTPAGYEAYATAIQAAL